MRDDYADRLRCPRCRAQRPFRVTATERDAQEIRAGHLTCGSCGLEPAIVDGFVDLLHDPPDFVVKESDGLERFAQVMRDEHWKKQDILDLPYIQQGYWYAQAVLMEQTLQTVPFEPGQTIVDLGSNTCWATTMLAKHGLEATALDISPHQMQGLRTADWQMEAKDVFFERVLAVMYDMPFADASFDYVWACEVLHHNHRRDLARTMRECFRVLKPGGRLIVCNEPLRSLKTPKLNPGHEVAEFEGNEHAYMRFSYTQMARRAGFEVDVRGPWYHGLFRPNGIGLADSMDSAAILKAAAGALVKRRRPLTRAVLTARSYVLGGTALHMVCTKPG